MLRAATHLCESFFVVYKKFIAFGAKMSPQRRV